MVVRPQPVGDVAGALLELGQVLADAEAAARACEHDGPDVLGARVLEGGEELLLEVARERVQDFRPVERDREHGTLTPCLDFRHALSSRRGDEPAPSWRISGTHSRALGR